METFLNAPGSLLAHNYTEELLQGHLPLFQKHFRSFITALLIYPQLPSRDITPMFHSQRQPLTFIG